MLSFPPRQSAFLVGPDRRSWNGRNGHDVESNRRLGAAALAALPLRSKILIVTGTSDVLAMLEVDCLTCSDWTVLPFLFVCADAAYQKGQLANARLRNTRSDPWNWLVARVPGRSLEPRSQVPCQCGHMVATSDPDIDQESPIAAGTGWMSGSSSSDLSLGR